MSIWIRCPARLRRASFGRALPEQSLSISVRRLSLLRPHAHQLLAEIGALQEPHEGAGRAVEPFGDEFTMLDLAFAHPLRHVAHEVRMTRGEIADDETSDGPALGQYRTHPR